MTLKSRSACPLSCALELFGDKWTFLIIRDMAVLGKKNFKEFMTSPEGISTSVLTHRLNLLVEHGIVSKRKDRKNKLIIHYHLTKKGEELIPILISFIEWSLKHVSTIDSCPDATEHLALFNALKDKHNVIEMSPS